MDPLAASLITFRSKKSMSRKDKLKNLPLIDFYAKQIDSEVHMNVFAALKFHFAGDTKILAQIYSLYQQQNHFHMLVDIRRPLLVKSF